MKHVYYLLFAGWLTAMAACNNDSASRAVAAQPTVSAAQAAPQLVDISAIRINEQVHQAITTAALQRQMGPPSSVARGAVECGGELATATSSPGDFWHYPDAMYEVNGDRAILASFTVASGKFQGQAGPLQLNQRTTLADVRRLFPAAVREAEVAGPETRVRLPFGQQGRETEGACILEFAAGRLVQVHFWYPC